VFVIIINLIPALFVGIFIQGYQVHIWNKFGW